VALTPVGECSALSRGATVSLFACDYLVDAIDEGSITLKP